MPLLIKQINFVRIMHQNRDYVIRLKREKKRETIASVMDRMNGIYKRFFPPLDEISNFLTTVSESFCSLLPP